MQYKNHYIEDFGSGYTVFYMGNEIYFDTIEGACEFIDELEN